MESELDNTTSVVDMTWLKRADVFRYVFGWSSPRLSREIVVYAMFDNIPIPESFLPSSLGRPSPDYHYRLERIDFLWYLDDFLLRKPPSIGVNIRKWLNSEGELRKSASDTRFHTYNDYNGRMSDDIRLPQWLLNKGRFVVWDAMRKNSNRWEGFDSSGDLMRHILDDAGEPYRQLSPLVKQVFGEDYNPKSQIYQPDMLAKRAHDDASVDYDPTRHELNEKLASAIVNLRHSDVENIEKYHQSAMGRDIKRYMKLPARLSEDDPFSHYITIVFEIKNNATQRIDPTLDGDIETIKYFFSVSPLEIISIKCGYHNVYGAHVLFSSINPQRKLARYEDHFELYDIRTPAWMDRIAIRQANTVRDKMLGTMYKD